MKNLDLKEANPYAPECARIVRRYSLAEDVKFFQIRLCDMKRAMNFTYKPGQFVMLTVPGIGEAPFSISSTPSRPGLLEFGIRKVGKVTNALFELKENATVGLRGPYGNGFPLEKMEGNDLIVVVGGLGAVPLRSLILYALDNRDKFGELYFLYGAKTPKDMLFREEFLALRERDDFKCLLSVDRDEKGIWPCYTGVVTSLFKHIKEIDPKKTMAAVCGPPVMYKYVIDDLLKLFIPKHQIFMTLERRMKCGVGKCGHCVIGYVYTCIEGPVFTYWDVIHLRELI